MNKNFRNAKLVKGFKTLEMVGTGLCHHLSQEVKIKQICVTYYLIGL